jgi:hypothetical protein
MEKLGMARRRRRFFAGLLTFTFHTLCILWPLWALSAGRLFPLTGEDEPLTVLCEMDREHLEVGQAFILVLEVNHGEILEVAVIPPDFEDKFRLERQRSFMRLIRETSRDAERRSVFEFTLVPLEAGDQSLAPFAVHAREQSVWTESLPLTIAPPRASSSMTPPSFHWETPFPALKVGEWSVFRLIVTDLGALPKNALQRLRFEPPPEAVVESVALNPPGNKNAAVIELRVLPMRPGAFTVKAIEFEAENAAGTVMTLRIPELRATIRERE